MRNNALALALLLAACTTTQREPRIEVREVKVPIPVPCVVEPKLEEPKYPDTDEALKAAAADRNLFKATQLLLAGRKLRIAFIGEQKAALKGCIGEPTP